MNRPAIVGDLMTHEPVVTREEATVASAVRLLDAYGISALPVVDEGGMPVGVVSQTDLLRCRSRPGYAELRWSDLPVGDVMSRPAIAVDADLELADAARLMRDERVHRVVVVDDDGRAIGILSAMDFVALAADA